MCDRGVKLRGALATKKLFSGALPTSKLHMMGKGTSGSLRLNLKAFNAQLTGSDLQLRWNRTKGMAWPRESSALTLLFITEQKTSLECLLDC